MQFLVYLTVLMVSVSTVLLEIHWLTTPAPQPKPAVQASAAPPRPKVEGPNAELSPIYPRRVEPVQPVPTQNNVQYNVGPAGTGNTTAKAETTGAATRVDDPSKTAAKAETVHKPVVETTGVATRPDDPNTTKSPVPADNAQGYAAQPKQTQSDEAAGSSNRCDVQACASAYKSFRASDCTYQPFDGARRVCAKAPEQRADREQRDEPQRRSWSRREDSREMDRRTRWRVYDEDDDDADDVVLFRRSRRW
ncbi:MAG TPA: BA14K family protein [Pseudolabrys sp.]|nr:BA14K family protein [Pseudolabrys sp.]